MATSLTIVVTVVGLLAIFVLLCFLARQFGLTTIVLSWCRASREEKAKLFRSELESPSRYYMRNSDSDWMNSWPRPRPRTYKRFPEYEDGQREDGLDPGMDRYIDDTLPPQPMRPAPEPPRGLSGREDGNASSFFSFSNGATDRMRNMMREKITQITPYFDEFGRIFPSVHRPDVANSSAKSNLRYTQAQDSMDPYRKYTNPFRDPKTGSFYEYSDRPTYDVPPSVYPEKLYPQIMLENELGNRMHLDNYLVDLSYSPSYLKKDFYFSPRHNINFPTSYENDLLNEIETFDSWFYSPPEVGLTSAEISYNHSLNQARFRRSEAHQKCLNRYDKLLKDKERLRKEEEILLKLRLENDIIRRENLRETFSMNSPFSLPQINSDISTSLSSLSNILERESIADSIAYNYQKGASDLRQELHKRKLYDIRSYSSREHLLRSPVFSDSPPPPTPDPTPSPAIVYSGSNPFLIITKEKESPKNTAVKTIKNITDKTIKNTADKTIKNTADKTIKNIADKTVKWHQNKGDSLSQIAAGHTAFQTGQEQQSTFSPAKSSFSPVKSNYSPVKYVNASTTSTIHERIDSKKPRIDLKSARADSNKWERFESSISHSKDKSIPLDDFLGSNRSSNPFRPQKSTNPFKNLDFIQLNTEKESQAEEMDLQVVSDIIDVSEQRNKRRIHHFGGSLGSDYVGATQEQGNEDYFNVFEQYQDEENPECELTQKYTPLQEGKGPDVHYKALKERIQKRKDSEGSRKRKKRRSSYPRGSDAPKFEKKAMSLIISSDENFPDEFRDDFHIDSNIFKGPKYEIKDDTLINSAFTNLPSSLENIRKVNELHDSNKQFIEGKKEAEKSKNLIVENLNTRNLGNSPIDPKKSFLAYKEAAELNGNVNQFIEETNNANPERVKEYIASLNAKLQLIPNSNTENENLKHEIQEITTNIADVENVSMPITPPSSDATARTSSISSTEAEMNTLMSWGSTQCLGWSTETPPSSAGLAFESPRPSFSDTPPSSASYVGPTLPYAAPLSYIEASTQNQPLVFHESHTKSAVLNTTTEHQFQASQTTTSPETQFQTISSAESFPRHLGFTETPPQSAGFGFTPPNSGGLSGTFDINYTGNTLQNQIFTTHAGSQNQLKKGVSQNLTSNQLILNQISQAGPQNQPFNQGGPQNQMTQGGIQNQIIQVGPQNLTGPQNQTFQAGPVMKREASCDSVGSDSSITLEQLEDGTSQITGHLSVQIFYDIDSQDLEVLVMDGRDLIGPDPYILMDTFVRIFLLPDKLNNVQTRVANQSRNPSYKERFLFAMDEDDTVERILSFQVYCADKNLQTMIGEAQLKINNLDLTNTTTIELSLLDTKQKGISYGEILFSLSFLPTAERLTVVIVKAQNLNYSEQYAVASGGVLVKVYILHNGKKLLEKKTTVKKGTDNPLFNEAMIFNIPSLSLNEILLRVSVVEYMGEGNPHIPIGHVIVGSEATGKALAHWNQMITALRKPTSVWHPLRR